MTKQSIATYGTPLIISGAVFDAIRTFIGDHPAERGGMFGRDPDGVVRHFEADPGGRCTAGAYDPDINRLNKVITEWKAAGITFCGFAHSHPPGFCQPSGHDQWYAGEILACFKKLEALWVPIVQTVPDTGAFQILTFAAVPEAADRKRCSIVRAHLQVACPSSAAASVKVATEANAVGHIPATIAEGEDHPSPSEKVLAGGGSRGGTEHASPSEPTTDQTEWAYHGNFPCIWACSQLNPATKGPSKSSVTHQDALSALENQLVAGRVRDGYLVRLDGSYDLDLLDRTRLVVIGTGGGASLVRNAARMGFGEFVLIDPDEISATNVASQQATPAHIGRAKVTSLAEDIMATNPAAAVIAVRERIENITDDQFRLMLCDVLRARMRRQDSPCGSAKGVGVGEVLQPQKPERVVLLVLTDNFEAQARGHRLGLHFGVPTICAQEYHEGRGAEVTYTVPGITPACHRCITASRYRDYLQNGYKNDVTSAGAPIFAAEFLNGVLGHVLLAVAHHGTDHPRWGRMVRRMGARNLIRIRMDPDFDETFGNTFARRHEGAAGLDALFMLDALFLAQTPDHGQTPSRPVCPDCGGTGDLTSVIGTFDDTRLLRPTDPQYIVCRDAKGLLQLPRGCFKR